MSGLPLASSTLRAPSVTRSSGPVVATARPCRRARPAPLPLTASASISCALPRSTAGPCARRSAASARRAGLRSTLTGSSSQGHPSSRASGTACRMAAPRSASSMPRLTTRARLVRTKSPTTLAAIVMLGTAPAARRMLAERFMATKLVSTWTGGRSRRTRTSSSAAVAAAAPRSHLVWELHRGPSRWRGAGPEMRRRARSSQSLRRHDPDQVRRVYARKRLSAPLPVGHPVEISLDVATPEACDNRVAASAQKRLEGSGRSGGRPPCIARHRHHG